MTQREHQYKISLQTKARIDAKKYDLFNFQDDSQIQQNSQFFKALDLFYRLEDSQSQQQSQILKILDSINQIDEKVQKVRKRSFLELAILFLIVLIIFSLRVKQNSLNQTLKEKKPKNHSDIIDFKSTLNKLQQSINDLQNFTRSSLQNQKNQIPFPKRTFENFSSSFNELRYQIQNLVYRFDKLEHRFDNLDHRFDKLEHRFDNLDRQLDKQVYRFDLQNLNQSTNNKNPKKHTSANGIILILIMLGLLMFFVGSIKASIIFGFFAFLLHVFNYYQYYILIIFFLLIFICTYNIMKVDGRRRRRKW